MTTTYANLKKLSEKDGAIEFQAEIPAEILERHTLEELARYAEGFALPGFRKGKVPHALVRQHVGEMDLLEGAADEALRDAMRELVEAESLDVLGRPELTVTKIAPQNPLEFKIRFAKAPEVSLPDYRKIAKTILEKKPDLTVTDKEIDEAIGRIREMTGMTPANADNKEQGAATPLTDDEAKKFGPFENAEAFRKELAKNLEREKELREKDRAREEMIAQIVEHAKVKIPPMLVEQELREFVEDRDRRIADAGLSMEQYLKETQKTAEELEKEERGLIEKDIATSLVIRAMRSKEPSMEPSERDIQHMIARLKLHYPDRDEASLRRSAEANVIQEKLFAVLEGTDTKADPATPPAAEAPRAEPSDEGMAPKEENA
jgi:FKBP-type peptidyl-prolyl cis-trans isomerase (trigger factor)